MLLILLNLAGVLAALVQLSTSPALSLADQFVVLSPSIIPSPCVFPPHYLYLTAVGLLFQCSRSVSSGPVKASTAQVSDPGSASTPPS